VVAEFVPPVGWPRQCACVRVIFVRLLLESATSGYPGIADRGTGETRMKAHKTHTTSRALILLRHPQLAALP
jgi:hypothetical protein